MNQMNENTTDAVDEKLSADELAQGVINELASNGYSLADKVAVTSSMRRLLRTETEEAQKVLTSLFDRL